jgi:hypothetical protein
MSAKTRSSVVPPMDARDILRIQRRTAFIELIQILDTGKLISVPLDNELDETLDRFFKSGIELNRRQRENS